MHPWFMATDSEGAVKNQRAPTLSVPSSPTISPVAIRPEKLNSQNNKVWSVYII